MSLADIKWRDPSSRWSFIKDFEKKRYAKYAQTYKNWFLDVSHYLGHQNVYYRTDSNYPTVDPKPSWRVRSISNILLPMARQVISQLARIEPLWRVPAATNHPDDIAIGEVSTDIAHHAWQEYKVYYKYLRALFWTCTTGNGFLKTGWDPELGPEKELPQNQEMEDFFETLGLGKEERPKTVNVGDAFVEWKSPFNLMFQDGIEAIEDSLFVIEANIKDLYLIKDKFGKKADKIGIDQDISQSGLYYLDNLNNLVGEHTSGIKVTYKDKSIVYDVHVRPHRQLPKGMHFIMSQGIDLIKPAPFPYKHKRIPYVHLPEVPVPGQLYATSVLRQNRPNQVIRNRFDSQIIEYINLMLKGKWLVHKTSKIPPQSITDAPGEIIRWAGIHKPEQARLLAFPRSIFDMRAIISQSMEDTASTHDITQGRAAGSVRSATQAQELKESDLSVLGPTQLLHDMALADLGRMLLSNIHEYVKEPRLAKITKNNRLSRVREFIGSDLAGNSTQIGADYFNVIITTDGRAPWSRTIQRGLIRELTDGGWIRPGEHDNMVFKALRLDNAEVLLENDQQARAKQHEEDKLMEQGQEVVPEISENHKAHLEEIALYTQSEAWDGLPEEVKQVRRKHEMQHREMVERLVVLPTMLQQKAMTQLPAEIGIDSSFLQEILNGPRSKDRTETGTGTRSKNGTGSKTRG